MSDISQAITDLRGNGWTQIAIALALGVTDRTLWNWQTGHTSPQPLGPTLQALEQLAKRKRIPRKVKV